ncbi:MAG: HAD-IA family hydrolase [Gammaproteobacteria bacterium]|nr:HAD-IA family hydrolase [Gammaproteobacteria bacterium]
MAIPATAHVQAVLFDLDGTLLDTAPDLVSAVNGALAEAGLPMRPPSLLRPLISHGAAAMLRSAIPDTDDDAFDTLLQSALIRYRDNLANETRFFDGMTQVLDQLERFGTPWGIVTNKLARFTDPLLAVFELTGRASVVISGDTTERRKPDPLPLREACRRIGRAPQACVYVGDARTDIEAGRRAGMMTLTAHYGYLGADHSPDNWGADAAINHPLELLNWLHARIAP